MPSEADGLVASGSRGRPAAALELEPGRADAAIPLARCSPPPATATAALALLANVPGSFAAEGLATRLRLADDPELAAAFAALDAGETEAGLDALIDAIAAPATSDRKDELRQVVVGVLDELGPAHPLARDARRKLADRAAI